MKKAMLIVLVSGAAFAANSKKVAVKKSSPPARAVIKEVPNPVPSAAGYYPGLSDGSKMVGMHPGCHCTASGKLLGPSCDSRLVCVKKK